MNHMHSSVDRIVCVVFILIIYVVNISYETNIDGNAHGVLTKKLSREKRALVFLEKPLFQLTVAFTLQFALKLTPMQISYGFQANYILPHNITEVTPNLARVRREVSLATSFLELEGILDGKGFNGSECLLRSICELAESPLDRDGEEGMLEEVLHAILTPSESVTSYDRYDTQPYDYEVFQESRYLQAEHLGKTGANCIAAFPGCDQSPLDMITNKFTVF